MATLRPGRALDVGCGEGGDALWLAEQGWDVLGVDVSRVALDRAATRARETGMSARTAWEHRDLLTWSPPAAAYDLVTVAFVHLAGDQRREVYASLAEAVAPGGTFLVVAHHPDDLGVVPRPPHPGLLHRRGAAPTTCASLRGPGTSSPPRQGPPQSPSVLGNHPVTLHDTVLRARRRGDEAGTQR